VPVSRLKPISTDLNANGALTRAASGADDELVESLSGIDADVNRKTSRERCLPIRDRDCAAIVTNDV
jgi:hypothetical protein